MHGLGTFRLTLLAALVTLAGGCGSHGPRGSEPSPPLVAGQSDFESVPPTGAGTGRDAGLAADGSTGGSGGGGGSTTAAPPEASKGDSSSATREVEETDLYRLDGDRLYYLNSYRGLMIFDVSDVDHPKLLGRSAIYGEPIEMVVRDGIASVVVADWYGKMDDGTPFHGSIVRGIDARDPSHIVITGEQYLGGWVRDTRVVGDVLYAVTEKYPYDYGWYGIDRPLAASTPSDNRPAVSVASVHFADGNIEAVDHYDVPGSSGVFHVTSDAILLASDVLSSPDANGYAAETGRTELRYLDISDPNGEIVERGHVSVDGTVYGWGADNGRWNLDFADGRYAHVVAGDLYASSSQPNMHLSTVDFGDPDAPVVTGTLTVPSPGYSAAARFDGGRLYFSANDYGCYDSNGNQKQSVDTPLDVFDVSDPVAPRHLGSATIAGEVFLMMPNGDRLFALGQTYDCASYQASPMALAYFDMSDPTHPHALGTAQFGTGWAWTPAAGTFKAFTKDDAQGLVVLPFSGWDDATYRYNTGLQLFEFDESRVRTAGAGLTHGWVERGIFVKNRLVSLSDLALSVIDYSDHDAPVVVNELTLARNVVNARPVGDNVVEVSSDFWDNDVDHSEVRVIPADQAEENTSDPALASVTVAGTNPSVFHDGDMTYVVSNVRHETPCPNGAVPGDTAKASPQCFDYTQAVTVVDVSGGTARVRGTVELPSTGYYGWGWTWGWYACDMVSWYYGSDVVQVGNKLAFRRWMPQYDSSGEYVNGLESLFVVDAANPDAPTLGSAVITDDPKGWWGDLQTIGGELYASHYEWVEDPSYTEGTYSPGRVAYYVDRIDLGDPAHPRVQSRINVPGVLVGGSATDPSLLYTMDYRWTGTASYNELAVVKVDGERAYLQGHLEIPGYTGQVYVRGDTAYFSAEVFPTDASPGVMRLYQVDLSDPSNPVALPSASTDGWGWLLAVEGDRAFVTSGWYGEGIDVFKLAPGAEPTFDRFVRTRGWWPSSLAVKDDRAYIASGYWGTQVVDLSE